jgi:hypothetical protein
MTCAIGAASALGEWGRTSCKRQVSGSIPLTGSQVRPGKALQCPSYRGTDESPQVHRQDRAASQAAWFSGITPGNGQPARAPGLPVSAFLDGEGAAAIGAILGSAIPLTAALTQP